MRSALIKRFHLASVVLNRTRRMHYPSKKILIVEDAGDWRELLRQVIGRSGYEVLEVDSGQEAIDQAAAVHPDLILLDLGLPAMNADQIIRNLRTNFSTKDIPVIAQTMFDDYTGARLAIEAGAKEVLYRPFDLSELPTILRRHLPT
jgi:CheY-like chemotaxis protein